MASCDCTGCTAATSAAPANRPGLSRIAYRAGTWSSFRQAMVARLAGAGPLRALHARAATDPAIALFDAWAVAADVLSFYNERIANEAYLATATERRSVLELARMTGYRLRPGVAASVYLAYQVDANAGPVTIPAGTRSQSVPGPGQQMQTFETAEPLAARAAWNAIAPRLTIPQVRSRDDIVTKPLYLQGVDTRLARNDALLVRFGADDAPLPYRVAAVALEEAAGRTRVDLRPWNGAPAKPKEALPGVGLTLVLDNFDAVIDKLLRPPKIQPANALRLARDAALAYAGGADVYPQLLQQLQPALDATLYGALRNAPVAPPVPLQVWALRVAAPLFAHNAPRQPRTVVIGVAASASDYEDPTIATTWGAFGALSGDPGGLPHVALDRAYGAILPGADSYAVIDRPPTDGATVPGFVSLHRVTGVATATMGTPAGAAQEVTQLAIAGPWLRELDGDAPGQVLGAPAVLRGTRVYAQSEPLALAEEPLPDDVCDADGQAHELELAGLVDGLKPGRWLFLSGERSDLAGVPGLPATELVMLAAVRNGVRLTAPPGSTGSDAEPLPSLPLPGERTHTFITLAQPLAYCYKRATVTLQANVVRATHGETRREALGGGDPSIPFQQFPLKQGPLTWLAAATETGAASTLAVRVNGLLWHEQITLAGAGPQARAYITRCDDAGQTSVVFGDGADGQRPPGGSANIQAVYRGGIGVGGNVDAGQIALATDKPLGVAGVSNPQRASGGADPDRLEQARRNAPLAVMTLGRLVSVRDYADFARAFAGIGKASAVQLVERGRRAVVVTIAGVDDQPVDPSADLFRNLLAALRDLGDPQLPLRLQLRDALALTVRAQVALLPDYAWEEVAPRLRTALNLQCGFDAREIGQAVQDSVIVGAIQNVRGVAWARVTVRCYGLDDLVLGLGSAAPPGGVRVAYNQLAWLPTTVPDALILELLP